MHLIAISRPNVASPRWLRRPHAAREDAERMTLRTAGCLWHDPVLGRDPREGNRLLLNLVPGASGCYYRCPPNPPGASCKNSPDLPKNNSPNPHYKANPRGQCAPRVVPLESRDPDAATVILAEWLAGPELSLSRSSSQSPEPLPSNHLELPLCPSCQVVPPEPINTRPVDVYITSVSRPRHPFGGRG